MSINCHPIGADANAPNNVDIALITGVTSLLLTMNNLAAPVKPSTAPIPASINTLIPAVIAATPVSATVRLVSLVTSPAILFAPALAILFTIVNGFKNLRALPILLPPILLIPFLRKSKPFTIISLIIPSPLLLVAPSSAAVPALTPALDTVFTPTLTASSILSSTALATRLNDALPTPFILDVDFTCLKLGLSFLAPSEATSEAASGATLGNIFPKNLIAFWDV